MAKYRLQRVVNSLAADKLAKQLTQMFRGGIAMGMDRAAALALAIRCARDSMLPLRLALPVETWPPDVADGEDAGELTELVI